MKWLRWSLPLVAIALVLPASAQSVDPSIRQAVEGLAATFAEHYNKQDAAAVAGTFTKDGVLVAQSAQGAVWSGTQALAQRYEGLFKLGATHIDITTTQVVPLGNDVAIVWGEYHTTGQGQSGPINIEGAWSATDVRDAGIWKIRLLSVLPKAPAPATK